MKRLLTLGALLPLFFLISVQSSHARPEGTRQLGASQGLDPRTKVLVRVQEVGETLHFCTSDNQLQEEDVDGQPLDRNPGSPVADVPWSSRADIYLFPPEPFHCDDGAACPADQTCIDEGTRRPAENTEQPVGALRCAFAYDVNPTGQLNAGYCNASTDNPIYHAHIASQVGTWRFVLLANLRP